MRLSQPRLSQASRVEEVATLLGEHVKDWTPELLGDMIQQGATPKEEIKALAGVLLKRPHLAGLSQDEFLAGLSAARPDLAALLASAAGREWLQRVTDMAGQQLGWLLLKSLWGG